MISYILSISSFRIESMALVGFDSRFDLGLLCLPAFFQVLLLARPRVISKLG